MSGIERKRLVYIAMPYSAPTKEGIQENVRRAREFAISHFSAFPRCFPLVPHNLGTEIEEIGNNDFWYGATASVLMRCDAVVFGPGWEKSRGCALERGVALNDQIPTFEWDSAGNPEHSAVRLRAFLERFL